MKRTLIALALLALIMPAYGDEEWKCDKSTQDCLDGMVTYLANHGYAGIELEPAETGMRVKEVAQNSPAAEVGMKVGDILVTVDGKNLAEMSEEGHHAMAATFTPASTHKVKIDRDGESKWLTVTLVEMPDDVLARNLGKHMLTHATADLASN